MAETTYPVPAGTTWIDDVGNVWTSYGADVEVTAPGDWREVAFVIEVRRSPSTGMWDTGEWDTAEWFDPALDDLYTWTDITDDYVKAVWSTAKRPKFGAQFTPGTASIIVKNADGLYTLGASSSILTTGQVVRITAVHGGVEYVKFRGVISAAPGTDTPGKAPLVTISVRSPLAAIARQPRPAQTATGAGDLPGVRVARILDSIAWPSVRRSIDDGVETLQATTLEGSALSELQAVALAEGGEVFHDDAGTIVFYDRATVDDLADADPAFTVGGYADPSVPGVWIPYTALTFAEDVDRIKNHVTIGSVGNAPYTVLDVASIDEYGVAMINKVDLINDEATTVWASTLAARLVAASKDPTTRYAVTLTGGVDSAVTAVLTASILDVVRVRRYTGAVEVDHEALIEGMTFTAKPARPGAARTDSWIVKITTGAAG